MSIKVMSRVWEMDLPAKDKLILLALADCANDEGTAWPSVATLARKCGCDQRTIQRNLRDLEKVGAFRREEVPGKGCKYHFTPLTNRHPRQNDGATKTPKTPGKLPPKPSRTIGLSNDKPREARLRPLPADWGPVLTTRSQKIVDGWPPGMFEAELNKFRDHAADKGRTSKDWQAAFRKWIDNAEQWKPKNDRPRSPNDRPTTRQIGERVAARLAAGGGGPAYGLPQLGSSGGHG